MTRRSFLRNLGALTGVLTLGYQRAFRKDYYKTFTIRGPDNSVLVGFKGSQFCEAGYIYAPYIPLYRTPDIVPPKPTFLTKARNLLQLS